MSSLADLAKGFKKCLRFTDELKLSKELKDKLKAKVKEEAKFYTEVQDMNVRIAKIDRKFNHGIKSYEASGLGSLLNQQKVEIFYGEDNAQGKVKAKSRQDRGKVRARLRQGQGKVKARSWQGQGKVKARS